MRYLREEPIKNQTVLVQSNLDVPLEEGVITDDSRLRASLETIQLLFKNNCKVILAGHLGRPEGKVVPELSTLPVANRLTQLLGTPVNYIPGVVGGEVKEAIDALPEQSIAILENTRFEPGEEEPTQEFAEQLAALADAFVNDEYINAHRKSCINTLLPTLLPSYMGLTLEKEYRQVKKAIDNPEHPVVLIIGGAKKDKIGVINNLLGIADHIIVGGILANTFLKASGINIQGSKYDERSLEIAGEFLREQQEKFHLPIDVVTASAFKEGATHQEVSINEIPKEWLILDIGSQTTERYKGVLEEAKTIIWGGPIGVFEWEPYRRGTTELAKAVAANPGYTLIAGGDSGAAINSLGLQKEVSHVSIGGGATLTLIAGGELPAVTALLESTK